MSIKNWNAGIIRPVPVAPAGPYQNSAASGTWTLDQAAYWQKQGLWPIPGNINPALFIENLFSTYLYTGNGTSQTITNGINLSPTGSAATSGIVLSNTSSYGIGVAADGSYSLGGGNYLIKVSANNAIEWQKSDTGYSFRNSRIDSSGNVYTVAHSGSTVLIAKYNSAGTAQWIKTLGATSTPDDVFGLAITSDGNLFLGWGSSPAVSMKVDSSTGAIIWQKTLTATNLKNQDVATDSSGNCYQMGYAGSPRYVFVVKLNSSGSEVWQKQFASSDGSGGLFGYGIAADSSSNVYINTYVATAGTNYVFVVKCDSAGVVVAQRGWANTVGSSNSATNDSSGNLYFSFDNGYVAKYNSSLSLQWVRLVGTNSQRVNLGAATTELCRIANGKVIRLKIDGSTVEGTSSNDTSFSYSTPVLADSSTSAITNSNASISIGTASYSASNTTFANNATAVTATAQTFPAIPVSSGGLTWIKQRSAVRNNLLFDTTRGATKPLYSNLTFGEGSDAQSLTAFTSTGFSIGSDSGCNISAGTYVSWTFREQAKFFDVVTWTGNDATSRTLSHSINGTVGCVMVKKTSSAGNWIVWHRTFPTAGDYIILNSTAAKQNDVDNGISTTNTTFTVGYGLNVSGENYVAYLFAHNAGGFGLTGADNVISCGSYVGNGTSLGPVVNLGYEPQWLLVKDATNAGNNWILVDVMRGFIVNPGGDNCQQLEPNSTTAEFPAQRFVPNSTGFQATLADSSVNGNGSTYIYIAIRRGPMKTPTTGTSVFAPTTYTGAGTSQTVTSGLQTAGGSLVIIQDRTNASASRVYDTLRGPFREIYTQSTSAEVNRTSIDAGLKTFNMNGFSLGSNNYNGTNQSGVAYVAWQFRRAPSFMDVVCYTGTGTVGRQITHNLGVAPELSIIKTRSLAGENWNVWQDDLGTSSPGNYYYLQLNQTNQRQASNDRVSTATSTTITVGDNGEVNASGATYVMYLFATCPGVSKVGIYTGTGTTKQIDCGFTSGARFVLIKSVNSAGDWYVWDSARGIVAGNDPYLLLNSTAAEVTNTDYVDTLASGFEISSTAPAAINALNDTFVFLAIA